MEKIVKILCVLSVFCALVTNLMPEGREKRVMRFVCSVVLLSALFRYVREPDWDSLALESARLRQREEAFLQDAERIRDELQRTVIEDECRTYILNKARQMQIDLAHSGAECIQKFAVYPYDLVFLDYRMPQMDGLEAAKTIRSMDREDAKRIPIIALTDATFGEDVQLSMQAGMDTHLNKPVEAENLIRLLGELIYESEEKLTAF